MILVHPVGAAVWPKTITVPASWGKQRVFVTIGASDFETTEVVEVNGGYSDNHMISVGSKVVFKNIPGINNSKKSKI